MLCKQCDRPRPANARAGGSCANKCGGACRTPGFKICLDCSDKKKVCEGCGASTKPEKKPAAKANKEKKKEPAQKLTIEQALKQIVELKNQAHSAGFQNNLVVASELGMQAGVTAHDALEGAVQSIKERLEMAAFKQGRGESLECLEALSQAAGLVNSLSLIVQNALMAQQIPDAKCSTK